MRGPVAHGPQPAVEAVEEGGLGTRRQISARHMRVVEVQDAAGSADAAGRLAPRTLGSGPWTHISSLTEVPMVLSRSAGLRASPTVVT